MTTTEAAPQEPKDDKEAARQELARRELARRHLLPFIQRFQKDYLAGWVHKDICQRLERFSDAIMRKESPRLMLFLPPRAGKSLIASQYFPAWHFGRMNTHEIISASYSQSLQIDFSRKIQELMRSKEYQQVFPDVQILKNNEALERWGLGTAEGKRTNGGFLAAGVGGPITGRGAHCLIIDDPVKNREEADSAVMRANTKAWYSSTASTRLAPGGGVLIIQTRWHDDDLAGWMLTQMESAQKEFEETGVWPKDAERWEVVTYPAIATEDEQYRKKGEALHPERFPIEELLKKKRSMLPRDWSALYQQSPIVEEGAYFEKRMIHYYHSTPPQQLDVYAAADLAISKDDSACYTVIMVAGLDFDDKVYMLDERRGQWDADQIVEQIIDVIRVWRPLRFGIEKGQISMAIGPHLERRFREEKIRFGVEEMPPTHRGNKEARARPLQGRMARGQVLWPASAMWVDKHLNELLRFPTGLYNDRVDADAWICQMLADAVYRSRVPKKARDWKSKLKAYTQGRNRAKTSVMAC
ncbi:MAG: phage terminase large subunit [Cyanobium sp.]|nr:phage terminase large subunit [Cyanobium sp.]